MGLNMFLSLLLMLSLPAHAQDSEPVVFGSGNFTILDQYERAPFGGVLFDTDATASLLTLPGYYRSECDLRLEYSLGQLQAESQLEIDQLNIRIGTLTSEYDSVVTQKGLEIASLQEIVRKNSRRNHWIWGAVGIVVGASATVAIVRTTSN